MNGAVTMGSNEYNSGNNNNSEASPAREEYRKEAETSPPPAKISKRDKERERDRERRERRERDRDREEREREPKIVPYITQPVYDLRQIGDVAFGPGTRSALLGILDGVYVGESALSEIVTMIERENTF